MTQVEGVDADERKERQSLYAKSLYYSLRTTKNVCQKRGGENDALGEIVEKLMDALTPFLNTKICD